MTTPPTRWTPPPECPRTCPWSPHPDSPRDWLLCGDCGIERPNPNPARTTEDAT